MKRLKESDERLVWGSEFRLYPHAPLMDVQVHRTARFKGVLGIFDETGKLAHTEEVSVSYDARFGPDEMDIRHWQQLVENHFDEQP